MRWFEQAEAAEAEGDWDTAIGLVSPRAACYSADSGAHGHHLWHMELLARAGRFAALTELALTDPHARRSLHRSLRERGMAAELRERAERGDRGALYTLVRMLCETNRAQEARRTVQDLDPENAYAHRLLDGPAG
ncbi:hypothetical protein ABT084_02890 [Streptomyces sp. NPDC002138]|uniref:hypothetical protein n=1 Tax=Streptomyces sp. NPDC002138 TaxID=3154410 RepID=UPI00331C8C12